MPKFTLICEHIESPNSEKNTAEFTTDSLSSVMDNIEFFLKGCGFVFNGRLDFRLEEYDDENSV